MRLQTTNDIFDYWNEIRGSDFAPLQSQIKPRTVGHILSSLFILETRPEERIAFRLAGTRICDLFGRDLSGVFLSDLWAHGHEDIEKTALGVTQHAIPAMLNATGYSTAGHRAAFEMVMLPLRSNEATCDRLLGALVPATTPSWLEVVPLEFLALDRSRLLHEKLGVGPIAEESKDPVYAGFHDERAPGLAETMRRMMSHLLEGPAIR